MQNRKTPQIRFKGYTDAWEQRKLGEFASVTKLAGFEFTKYVNYGLQGNIVALRGLNIKSGELDLSDVKYIDNSDFTKLHRSKLYQGDVVFTYVGTIGEVTVIPENDRYYLAPNVALIRFNKSMDPKFAIQQIGSERFYNHSIVPLIATSSQPALSMENIRKFLIMMPSMTEQIKLREVLNKIDHIITLHQRKCDKLKIVKKSMLEKMFPKNGENSPQIRFKGYTDAWEHCKIYEMGNIVTGSTPKTNISDYYGGTFLFISPIDIQGNRYVDKTATTLTKKGFDQGRKIREKASLFVSIGSTIGKVAQTIQESTTNQQINAIEPYDDFDDDFIFTCLENTSEKIKFIASNQAVPIVNKTTFGKTEICVASKLLEQRKIGSYFRNIDKLISLHQNKVDKLKQLKKAMLEKMFV